MAVHLRRRAIFQCDWETDNGAWGCTAQIEYQAPMMRQGHQKFIDDATAHAREQGWELDEQGRVLCPECVGRPTNVERRSDSDDMEEADDEGEHSGDEG